MVVYYEIKNPAFYGTIFLIFSKPKDNSLWDSLQELDCHQYAFHNVGRIVAEMNMLVNLSFSSIIGDADRFFA
ncbi:MAG TPA: hypothetical protein DIC35_00445 [Candidatus Moranbacteria bacterium]|nr:hypothetical protein [Candidatus Moranbacteria bacterium]